MDDGLDRDLIIYITYISIKKKICDFLKNRTVEMFETLPGGDLTTLRFVLFQERFRTPMTSYPNCSVRRRQLDAVKAMSRSVSGNAHYYVYIFIATLQAVIRLFVLVFIVQVANTLSMTENVLLST